METYVKLQRSVQKNVKHTRCQLAELKMVGHFYINKVMLIPCKCGLFLKGGRISELAKFRDFTEIVRSIACPRA
jgi:hypothetical protein